MPKLPGKILHLPLYPWLVSLLPILHLYSVNFGAVIDREVPICVIWIAGATTIIYLAAYAFLRDRHQSALITSCVVLGFSLSGHIHGLFFDRAPLAAWTLIVAIVIALAVAALQRIRIRGLFAPAALPLNLIFLAMISLQMAALATNYANTYAKYAPQWQREGALPALENSPRVKDSNDRPDIYYIIPDGYPSDAWLQSAMDFDNSAFTEALRARGFKVASHAQSNYGFTLTSLASTLDMRLIYANATELHDLDYLRLSIANNQVAQFLQQLGYTFIQFLSGYLFPSSIADINRDFTPSGPVDVVIDDDNLTTMLADTMQNSPRHTDMRQFYQQSFLSLYIESTWLKLFAVPLETWLEGIRIGSYDTLSPRRFLATIDEINAVVAMPEATFTVIHLLKPHRPTVFDENGNIIEKIGNPNNSEHLAELRYINSEFIAMMDTILEGSDHPPVIIFQADHGSTRGNSRRAGYRLIHFDTYSAYYVPPRHTLEIPRPHTAVNTFPLILNAVFDAGLEFVDNRLFEVSISKNLPMELTDVTEIFAHR